MKNSLILKIGISFLLALMVFGAFSLGTAGAASVNKPKTPITEPTSTPTQTAIANPPMQPSLHCLQPNRNQDISTLTLQDRIDQGYPIPVHGKTDPTIDKVIHDKGKHFCADTDVIGTHHPSGHHTSTANATHEISDRNWSGNEADGGQNYTYAQAYWTESCAAWGTNDHWSTWAGIGGVNNSQNLLQSGAEDDNTLTYHGYSAWVQNTAVDQLEKVVFGINCGDNMLSEVGAGNCMLIVDQTSGASSGWRCYGANPDSSTAECIVEAPVASNGSVDELSNYGTEQFRGCAVEINSGSTVGINTVPHDYDNMFNGSTLLSSTGPITNNDTYTMTWHAYS
jgi:hypothetical protein